MSNLYLTNSKQSKFITFKTLVLSATFIALSIILFAGLCGCNSGDTTIIRSNNNDQIIQEASNTNNSTNQKILFKGGTIITASSTQSADVYIADGKISKIAENLSADELGNPNDLKVVDITGKYLLPGAIDAHVHLDLDCGAFYTADTYETGTRAAACGGTTMVIDYPTQINDTKIVDAVTERIEMCKDTACVDYGFHCALTDFQDGKLLEQFQEAIDAGITSFKCYMVYKSRGLRIEDDELEQILAKAKETGALVNVHCEDEEALIANQNLFLKEGKTSPWYHYASRPEDVSGEGVKRAVSIANKLDAPIYIVHTDSDKAIQEIENSRSKGYKVYSETCPQYLNFTSDVYNLPDGYKFVCSPSIKPIASQNALWNGILNGAIQTIATDHCPFNLADKSAFPQDFTKIPNGCAGIENNYPYMLSCANEGKLSFNKVVELCCKNPALLFGCSNKGDIAEGLDADLVVYDPNCQVTINQENQHTAADHTIWDGVQLKGYPVATYCRGRLVYENGEFVGEPGWGKYVIRDKAQLM